MDLPVSEFLKVSAVYLLAILSPGPDFLITVKNALKYGTKQGILTALGIAVGTFIHTIYSIVGVGFIINKGSLFFQIIQGLGAVYLIYMGLSSLLAYWKAFRKASGLEYYQRSLENQKGSFHSFLSGFLTDLLNPKTIIFFLAISTQLISPKRGLLERSAYAAEIVFLTALWFIFLSILLSRGRQNRLMNWFHTQIDLLAGVVLVIVGVRLL